MSKGNIQTNRVSGGGASAAASDAEVLGCLADIKALIAELCEKIVLGDDATALAEIIAQLSALCDKLLDIAGQNVELLAELQALCDKILAGNETLTEVLAELQALCEKFNRFDFDECCTGGATDTTAQCANIPKSWTTGTLGNFDRCTYSFGGIDLPNDNYTFADFEALITGVGGTIEVNPNNPDQYTICVPDGFRTCYQSACFSGNVGQISRACVITTPNTTEEVCKDYLRTWGKYEEPIGNTLASSLDVLQQLLEKQCETNALLTEILCGPAEE